MYLQQKHYMQRCLQEESRHNVLFPQQMLEGITSVTQSVCMSDRPAGITRT